MTKPTDRCRTGIPKERDGGYGNPFSSARQGVKTNSDISKPSNGLGRVVNQPAWGEREATSRYGGGTRTFPGDAKANGVNDLQKSQGTMDRHAPAYRNDTPNNWLRGGGKGQAESRPGYVKGFRSPGNSGESYRVAGVEEQGGQPLRSRPVVKRGSATRGKREFGE